MLGKAKSLSPCESFKNSATPGNDSPVEDDVKAGTPFLIWTLSTALGSDLPSPFFVIFLSLPCFVLVFKLYRNNSFCVFRCLPYIASIKLTTLVASIMEDVRAQGDKGKHDVLSGKVSRANASNSGKKRGHVVCSLPLIEPAC